MNYKLLAKTYNGKPGRDIETHCSIVGDIAKELTSRLPDWLQEDLYPPGIELIAACHDIGKVSPTFQRKLYEAIGIIPEELSTIDSQLEREWGGHAGVSYVSTEDMDIGRYIPEILGRHHGYLPNVNILSSTSKVLGGKEWQGRRVELVDNLKSYFACEFPRVKSKEHANILAGLTTVSDWLGSSSLFEDPSLLEWDTLVKKAVDDAGFIRPLIKKGMSFGDIFGFAPRDNQVKLHAEIAQGGVYILESPMGHGKTESALYAAYKLLENSDATGIYFALPTQLTSEKIYDRVNWFLDSILERSSSNALLHSNAWMRELGVEGNPNGSWFSQGKRGILSPFAVGTLDQALMAAMNVKHSFVRSYGLVGKVVILDEVHCYDSYTGVILDKLIGVLRELKCTVIIMSATLTDARRGELLGVTTAWTRVYPRLTIMDRLVSEVAIAAPAAYSVSIGFSEESLAISEVVRRVGLGEQVLWIENTVSDAQRIYRKIASMGLCTGLLHSRFTRLDREANEGVWVNLYGKDSGERGLYGRVLIGTQVVEQSIDIDADFLVTRFAPTDMILQRIGRLWRHSSTVRASTAKCEAWLLAPVLELAIKDHRLFGKTSFVYSPYVLCRSLEVWNGISSISLPTSIPDLIEATYVDRVEVGEMLSYYNELVANRVRLNQLGSVMTSGVLFKSDENLGTRYSDQETVQVLLLRDYYDSTITFLNGEVVELIPNMKYEDRYTWRLVATKIHQNLVTVSKIHAPNTGKQSQFLKDYVYIGDVAFEDSMMRVVIVQPDSKLVGIYGNALSDKKEYYYDSQFGFVTKTLTRSK
jgi:CRISPR-associated endonuclease/helicase Cas3